MGNIDSRIHPLKMFPSRDLFNVEDNNGFVVLSELELNDDVLRMILSHISPKHLIFSCRLVCKNWCNLIDSDVWNDKLSLAASKSNKTIRSLPWHLKYWILTKDFLDRNLVKNCNGIDLFNEWKIISNSGSHWKIETPPVGTSDDSSFPSCFVTSFSFCSKEQILDLYKEGAKLQLMDEIQPEITVSEWYAGRFDCKAIYELEVNLMKDGEEVVDEFKVRERCGGDYGNDWRQVTHTFRNYGKGVRFIRFVHGGVDEQFWRGHYGSKMTEATVRLSIP